MGGFLCKAGSRRGARSGSIAQGGADRRRDTLRRSLRSGLVAAMLALTAAAVAPAFASAAEAEPFKSVLKGEGLKCSTSAGYQGGVRFCAGNGSTLRVPSWDGVPLDTDVTLPNESMYGAGPYPTIVMLHGYGQTKTAFESKEAFGKNTEPYYNNDYFAQQGYAVVNYTARGFGKSCGVLESGTPECEKHGFVHLADQRYEARDTQYLLGLLVEEGIAKRGALGVTGISYGGGQSITLAYLKNRIRCAGPPDETYAGEGANPCAGQPENALVPWETPKSKEKLEINAAYARWPWSDIANSLDPNGHFLEYAPATYAQDGASGTNSPLGIPLTSYQQALYSGGLAPPALGYYMPLLSGGVEWNLSLSLLLFEHPEAENPLDQEVVNGLSAYHGGFAVPSSEAPAPLVMESGWNDDLFPPEESLRVYNSVRERYGDSSYVALQLGDLGHSRGTNGPIQDVYFTAQGAAFFEEKLNGKSGATIPDVVTHEEVKAPAAGESSVFRTTCSPQTELEAGVTGPKPYAASSWQGLQRGVVELASTTPQEVNSFSSPENSLVSAEFDPILQEEGALGKTPNELVTSPEGEPKACRAIKALNPKGTATYLEPVTQEFTMMGLPTIEAKVTVSGTKGGNGQLDARLWEVTPGETPEKSTEKLVSRGDYRLEEPETANIVFQLHGNAYKFEKGHYIKLELTSSEYPYYYQSPSAQYSIAVSEVHAYLPTYDAPGAGPLVKAPVTLPAREPSIEVKPPVAKESPAKAIEKLVTTLPPIVAEHAPLCMTHWPVEIKLPKYRHGKITKAVIMFKGKRVKKVKIRKGSLKRVRYTIKGATGKTTTLKLRLKVQFNLGRKASKVKTKHVTRHYHLCGKA